MRSATLILPMLTVLVAAGPSEAQPVERYQLQKTDDGYVRMNTETGEMSICTEQASELTCRPAKTSASPEGDRMKALEEKVARLERRLSAMERKPETASELPSDAEVEKSLGIMERFFHRFVGIAKDFRDEMEKDKPAKPQGQNL